MGKFAFSVITEMELKLPCYLVGVGIDFHQEMDPHSRPRGYPHYQWIQCEEGEGILKVGDHECMIGPDQGIFLYPRVPHTYYSVTNPWKVHWLTFNGSHLQPILKAVGLLDSGVYSVVHGEQLVHKMRIAFYHLLSDSNLKGLECSSLVYDFLITMMKYIHRAEDEPVVKKYSRLGPVFSYIEKNFHKLITIDELAEVLQVTPQHLCHLFREALDQRPIAYVNSYRIAMSKDMMIQYPDLNLADVAEKCGYESLNYFSSVFRNLEGISPGEYRKLHLGLI